MHRRSSIVPASLCALMLAGCGAANLSSDAGSTGGGMGGAMGGHGGVAGAGAVGHAGSPGTGGATGGSGPGGSNSGGKGGAGGGGTTGGPSTGGTLGAGGRPGTGGTAGTAGTSGPGGTVGTGGTSGTGGSTLTKVALTVARAGTGSGAVTSDAGGINCGTACTASVDRGAPVTLTATPAAGSTFAGWSGGGCSGAGNCVVTLGAAATVTGTFTLQQLAVTVTKAGTGSGTVTSSPAGINCGSTCTAAFDYGASVTLTATPASGSTFVGWSGGGCSGTATCVVSATAARTVQATYTVGPQPLLYYTLDDTTGANTGSVSGYGLQFSQPFSSVPGKLGNAIQFGSGGHASAQGSARAVLGAYPQYTISFWIDVSSSIPTSTGDCCAIFDVNNRFTAPYGGVQIAFFDATHLTICVATTSNRYLTGSCPLIAAPSSAGWHNIIIRYAGTGTSAGQGAGVDVYEDDVLVESVPNDAANDPVFNASISDTLTIGQAGAPVDDVRVYNQTFTVADQCMVIIRGNWTGSACVLP